jgi:hypothetical protein
MQRSHVAVGERTSHVTDCFYCQAVVQVSSKQEKDSAGMNIRKCCIPVFMMVLLSLFTFQAASAPGYFPGSYYSAHVIREGGELLPNDNTESGYRWENFWVQRIKGNRIPAKAGHGLEVFADVYGMPFGQPVTLTVTRPVITAAGETGSRTYSRTQSLYKSDSDDVQIFNYTYFLDEPDDLVTGEWIIELTFRDTLILRQTFEVYEDPS